MAEDSETECRCCDPDTKTHSHDPQTCEHPCCVGWDEEEAEDLEDVVGSFGEELADLGAEEEADTSDHGIGEPVDPVAAGVSTT